MTTPEEFGDNTHPELWQQLEQEFDGTDDRATAIVANEQTQGLADLKAAILGMLPPEFSDLKFAPIRPPSYANGGVLANDGYPLILRPEDAYAVAKEYPDTAALMAHTANNMTSAKQQQLEVDMERAAGDEEAMRPLLDRKAALDYKRDRIEFWAAVAALHPVDRTAAKRYETARQYPFGDYESQVWSLVSIDEELSRLMHENREHSPAYFQAYEEAYGNEPGQQEVIKHMKQYAEDNAVIIHKYQLLLDDICYGRITASESLQPEVEEAGVSPELTDPALILLATLPGKDPILMAADNRLKELPQNGWLVTAKVKTAQQKGHLTICRYVEGGIEVSSVYHSDKYGEGRLGVTLVPGRFGEVVIDLSDQSDPRSYDEYSKESNEYRDTIAVGNGKHLQHSFEPLRVTHGTHHKTVIMHDVATHYHRASDAYKPYLETGVARMSDSPDEVRDIVAQIGQAMGMDESTVATTLGILTEKDAFGDLKTTTPLEQQALNIALAKRRPKDENDDEPYSDIEWEY